jgi:hypothetical protein
MLPQVESEEEEADQDGETQALSALPDRSSLFSVSVDSPEVSHPPSRVPSPPAGVRTRSRTKKSVATPDVSITAPPSRKNKGKQKAVVKPAVTMRLESPVLPEDVSERDFSPTFAKRGSGRSRGPTKTRGGARKTRATRQRSPSPLPSNIATLEDLKESIPKIDAARVRHVQDIAENFPVVSLRFIFRVFI